MHWGVTLNPDNGWEVAGLASSTGQGCNCPEGHRIQATGFPPPLLLQASFPFQGGVCPSKASHHTRRFAGGLFPADQLTKLFFGHIQLPSWCRARPGVPGRWSRRAPDRAQKPPTAAFPPPPPLTLPIRRRQARTPWPVLAPSFFFFFFLPSFYGCCRLSPACAQASSSGLHHPARLPACLCAQRPEAPSF